MPNKKANASTSILNPNAGLTTTPGVSGYGFKNPVDQDMTQTDITNAKGKDLKVQIGRSGTLIMSGFIIGEDYNKDLMGRDGIKTFDQMRRSDATIWALLEAVKTPLLACTDYIESNQGNGQLSKRAADEIRDFCEDQMFNQMDWESFKRSAYTFLEFGFSAFEKTFNIVDFAGKERVGFSNINYMKQYSIYRWQQGNGQPGIQQWLQSGGFRDIPDWKISVFTNKKEGDNYAGISVLRPIYKNWYMKDVLVKIDSMAHERHGVGTPVVSPSGDGVVAPEEMDKLEDVLRNQRSHENGYIRLPANTKLEAYPMSGSQSRDIISSIAYHNEQIFLSMLAQFLLLGQGSKGGSRALSEDTSSIFVHSLEFYANYFNRMVQDKFIRDLVDLNWGKDVPAPTLRHEKIGDDNVTMFADAIQKLCQAGVMTPTVETEVYIRDMLKMPALSDEAVNSWEKPVPAPTTPANPAEPTKEQKANEILDNARKMNERINTILG